MSAQLKGSSATGCTGRTAGCSVPFTERRQEVASGKFTLGISLVRGIWATGQSGVVSHRPWRTWKSPREGNWEINRKNKFSRLKEVQHVTKTIGSKQVFNKGGAEGQNQSPGTRLSVIRERITQGSWPRTATSGLPLHDCLVLVERHNQMTWASHECEGLWVLKVAAGSWDPRKNPTSKAFRVSSLPLRAAGKLSLGESKSVRQGIKGTVRRDSGYRVSFSYGTKAPEGPGKAAPRDKRGIEKVIGGRFSVSGTEEFCSGFSLEQCKEVHGHRRSCCCSLLPRGHNSILHSEEGLGRVVARLWRSAGHWCPYWLIQSIFHLKQQEVLVAPSNLK